MRTPHDVLPLRLLTAVLNDDLQALFHSPRKTFLRFHYPLFAPDDSYRSVKPPAFVSVAIENLLRGLGVIMRLGVIGGALCLCFVGISQAQGAHASIRKDLSIPAEPLGAALQDIAKVYELQLLYHTELAKDLKTQGAVGSFTPDDALTRVLSGTGLTYKFLDSNTITVYPNSASSSVQTASSASPDNASASGGGKQSSQDFRLAQVDQTPAGPQAVEKNSEEESGSKRKTSGLEEIVVTGTRIPTVAGQQVQPVRSYTRQDIEDSGQTTLATFFNTLPDVSVSTNINTAAIPGTSTVQLHGLPIGTTLTLINGLRVPNGYNGYFDLDSIPASFIERVDILPVGASAIYGADALGGAVNIITRNSFNGVEVDGAVTHISGENDESANLGWGKTWDRGSVIVMGTYHQVGELLGSQRTLTSTTDLPAAAQALGTDCSPGNVNSLDGENLPGLSSPQAAIPAGIKGVPSLQEFLSTQGITNQCNNWRGSAIVPFSQREGILASAHYQLSDSVDLFSEVTASRSIANTTEGSLLSVYGATWGASNPYNPFGTDVGVTFSDPNLPAVYRLAGDLLRPVVGIRGSLPDDWHYEASVYASRDRQDLQTPSFNNPTAVQTALDSADTATALNPAAPSGPGSPELLQSLLPPGATWHFVNQVVSGQSTFNGPLIRLPAGPLEVAVGGEYRQEKQYTDGETSSPQDLHRNAFGLFSEAKIPLLPDPAGVAGEDYRLALMAAGRYDHSDDFGGKATWQSGLRWRVLQSLSVTASYGVSYRAPQLQEIAGAVFTTTGNLGYTDPLRGNQPVNSYFQEGPNPHLKPETGNSRTLGIVYNSEVLAGLRVSANWFAININNYISVPNAQDIIDYPNVYPGAVVRGPPSAQDALLGYPGPITSINDSYANFGALRVAGVDADVSYAIDTSLGRFTPSVALANVYRWESALTPETPLISYVSQAAYTPGFAPRWKGTAALAWARGPLSSAVTGHYISRYLDYQDLGPNSNELGDYWIYDVYLKYQVTQHMSDGNRPSAGTFVAIGATNVLNRQPQISYSGVPYDPQEFDIRGRAVRIQAGVKW
jgi:iron complex outermembrane receptor protein